MFKLELIMETDVIVYIGLAVAAFVLYLAAKQDKKVDMNHKAPNVHNEQMKGRVGPPTAADKKAEAPAKKAPAKAKAKAKPAPKATAAKAPAKKKVPVSRMNKTDLMAHAKKQGVTVSEDMTKKEILDALKNK
jgi:type II secretory pathway component HofQ